MVKYCCRLYLWLLSVMLTIKSEVPWQAIECKAFGAREYSKYQRLVLVIICSVAQILHMMDFVDTRPGSSVAPCSWDFGFYKFCTGIRKVQEVFTYPKILETDAQKYESVDLIHRWVTVDRKQWALISSMNIFILVGRRVHMAESKIKRIENASE